MSFRVTVGNIGEVLDTVDFQCAKEIYLFYVDNSKHGIGSRGYEEEVVLWMGEHIAAEHIPGETPRGIQSPQTEDEGGK